MSAIGDQSRSKPGLADALSRAQTAAGKFIKRWRAALIVVGYAVLIGFCVRAIVNILSGGGFSQFAASLAALGPEIVLRSAVMVAATYGLMCIIEQLVLRDVFARLPLGATIAAPLIANSVSIGVGFGAVSGAAIRMRIYGRHGLDARNCVLIASGVTVVSLAGGACLAALGLAFEPEAVGKHLGVAPAYLRATGVVVLLIAATGLIAAGGRKRRLKLLGRPINLPSARSAATRLLVGATDWLASASVLFLLLPQSAQHNWLAFAAFFAALHFAAMSTGAPAGIGVFDAVMLGLNPTDANSGEMAAALVIYRLLSFLMPLALGTTGLVLFESHGSLIKSKREAPAKRISRGAIQRAVHFAGAWFATRAMQQQAGVLPPGAAPRSVGEILTAGLKAPATNLRALTHGKPILVIAPHPDDEVLGCGGLLAACAAAGIKAHVAFLTDGSLSHPGSASWSQKRLAERRAVEAKRAARMLGLSHRDLTFLNKRDGRLLFESTQMMRAGGELSRLARRLNVRTIFVTWRHDPHPDHIAAALIAAHIRRAAPHLRVFHYPIWAHLLPRDVSIADGPWRPIRLDVARWLKVKRRALTAYRTQTSTLIADAPITLRLQRDQLDRLMTRNEIYLRQG